MKKVSIIVSGILLILCSFITANGQSRPNRDFTGVYKLDEINILNVWEKENELLMKPFFWTTTLHLLPLAGDSFTVRDHTDRKIIFRRNGKDVIDAVQLVNFRAETGQYTKVSAMQPLQYIFNNYADKGIQELMKLKTDSTVFFTIGSLLVQRFATKRQLAENYLRALQKYFPASPSVYDLLGDNYMAAFKRPQATEAYRQAFKLDPGNNGIATTLKLLRVLPYTDAEESAAWKLPFSLDSFFMNPTPAEIKSVEDNWAARDLSAREVKEVASYPVVLGSHKMTAKIIAYNVHGFRNYGAIITPDNQPQGQLPVIIECKGVSSSFFPLDINNGLYTYKYLGADADKFIYLIPSYRGERMLINGKEYVSEGDKFDSWDGAADDALAFVNAAISFSNQIDQTRMCVFGKSRGGTIALLTGIRDKRMKYVIDLAGPTDWFDAMNELGWKKRETVEAGLFNKSDNFQIGGQTIGWAFKKSIEGKEGFKEARLRYIASSPLYFANRLPYTQLYYGEEDLIVPVANGKNLAERLEKKSQKFEFFIHKGEGHDLDKNATAANCRRLLLSMLRK